MHPISVSIAVLLAVVTCTTALPVHEATDPIADVLLQSEASGLHETTGSWDCLCDGNLKDTAYDAKKCDQFAHMYRSRFHPGTCEAIDGSDRSSDRRWFQQQCCSSTSPPPPSPSPPPPPPPPPSPPSSWDCLCDGNLKDTTYDAKKC